MLLYAWLRYVQVIAISSLAALAVAVQAVHLLEHGGGGGGGDDDDDDDDDGGSGIVESMVFISLASDEDDIIGFTSHSALVSRNLGRRREFLFG